MPIILVMLQCSNSEQGNSFPDISRLPIPIHWKLIMLTAEQIMASHKANIETMFGLTHKAF